MKTNDPSLEESRRIRLPVVAAVSLLGLLSQGMYMFVGSIPLGPELDKGLGE